MCTLTRNIYSFKLNSDSFLLLLLLLALTTASGLNAVALLFATFYEEKAKKEKKRKKHWERMFEAIKFNEYTLKKNKKKNDDEYWSLISDKLHVFAMYMNVQNIIQRATVKDKEWNRK